MAGNNQFEIHAEGLASLQDEMIAASERLNAETEKLLDTVGAEIYGGAKTIAGQHSKTIPGSLKLRREPGRAVIESDSTLARLYEYGNAKGSQDTGSRQGLWFRHPVYGNRNVFVNQRRYPFIRPVVDADRKNITKQFNATWAKTLEPLRVKGGK